ncbi:MULTISPECIES: 4a-hydroxytetrahydrobiopterin dehydratase [Cohnella]|uniref:4a-hydroxytetrahydrobiopterin dehydratase n=1 Tax=Cohnella TaxID=329857 RepID=UPI0009BACECE|nr:MULTISPECIES: 4a-hydroxytetrahydrobiopterin dehydratase [Cohnella]MBN2981312.1 4a-hydroxytetrahydrobiopterin dehydratase [Cohnella algarum]
MEKKKPLEEAELGEALRNLQGWKIEENKRIAKSYLFPSFGDAVSFVQKAADIAEKQNHHPFISIDYRRVTLRLTTWHSGGLTELDVAAAAAYDELYGPS